MLATGFLSYLGPFNQNFRNLLLNRWEKEMSANKIPFSDNLNLINMLTDAATVSKVEHLLPLAFPSLCIDAPLSTMALQNIPQVVLVYSILRVKN